MTKKLKTTSKTIHKNLLLQSKQNKRIRILIKLEQIIIRLVI